MPRTYLIFGDIEAALRKCADLADVQRAIASAAKLSAEKLEEIVSDLMSVLVATKE